MFVPESTINRVKVYEQKNAINKNAFLGNYYITQEKFSAMKSFVVDPGDIIVSCAGTIGEIYILPSNAEPGIINQALMRIRLYNKNIEEYFILYFDSVLKKEANYEGKGTAIKNIPPFEILKRMLLPLPPENEILRIINEINKINCFTDKIKTSYIELNKLLGFNLASLFVVSIVYINGSIL